MIKKTLRWVGLVVAGLILIGLAVAWAFSEVRPDGVTGVAANELANRMEQVLQVQAWEETGAVMWSFPGGHDHLWDKDRNLAKINWGENEVLVNLDTKEGVAFKKGKQLSGSDARDMVQKGWEYWVNDAFWLTAPFKAFDPGVQRSVVVTEAGDSSLLVSYKSGGDTPGDAYLWHFDEEGKPDSWKMWVSIIPIGGIKVPFDGWLETETGAILPVSHSGLLSINLTGVKTAFELIEWFPNSDPFAPLLGGEAIGG
ncbi:MAG: hypothetical protein NWR72_09085 [Bacteroidia bacterium]|nr:hypothetical protein [Bacteroidia bacterium]